MTSFATQSNIDMGGPGILGSDVSGASRRKSKLITIGAGLTLSGGALVNTLDLTPYALLPDTLPAVGTLLSYGGSRQLAAGGTVTHSGALNIGANAFTCGAITASGSTITLGTNAWKLKDNGASSFVVETSGGTGIAIFPASTGGEVLFQGGYLRLRGGSGPYLDFTSGTGISAKTNAGADLTLSCGAITASGNVNIGANSLVGTYSGIYNDGKWLTGSDDYGSFYISPNNASFAFAPPAAGAIVGTIDFAGRFNATTGFAVGSHDNANTTVRYYRNATGPKASIRAAGGLEVKDLAGSADAALTCGAITASGAGAVINIVRSGMTSFGLGDKSGDSFRVYNNGSASDLLVIHGTTKDMTVGGNLTLNGSSRIINLAPDNTAYTYAGILGTSGSRLEMYSGGRLQGVLGYNSGYDGLVLGNGTYGPMLWMGGLTSSFPAIKRSGTTTAFRLADDSADGPISCGAITASGTVTISATTQLALTNSAGVQRATINDYGASIRFQASSSGYPIHLEGNNHGIRVGNGTYTVDIKPVASNSVIGFYTGQGTTAASGALADIVCGAITASGASSISQNSSSPSLALSNTTGLGLRITDGTYTAGLIAFTSGGADALIVRNSTNTGNGNFEASKGTFATLRSLGAVTIEGAINANANSLTVGAITASDSITLTGTAGILGTVGGVRVPTGGNGFYFSGAGFFTSPSDGVFTFQNAAATSFGRLQLGGTTSSFPAIKRSGTTTAFRLADDSADGPISCGAITASGTTTVSVATATNKGLILKTTDDSITQPIFEVQNSVGSMLHKITGSTAIFGNLVVTTGVTFVMCNVQNTGYYQWGSRSVVYAPATGQFSFRNIAETAGATLDVTTDGTLTIKDRAGTATGNLSCGAATVLGKLKINGAGGSGQNSGEMSFGTSENQSFGATGTGAGSVGFYWTDRNADSATSIGGSYNALNLATAGAKIFQWKAASVEKAYISVDGSFVTSGAITASGAVTSTSRFNITDVGVDYRLYNAGGVLAVGTWTMAPFAIYTNGIERLRVADSGGITASSAIQETPTQSASDPTTSDIPTGKRMGWYNTTTGEFRDWVNIGGTLKKSAAYT